MVVEAVIKLYTISRKQLFEKFISGMCEWLVLSTENLWIQCLF